MSKVNSRYINGQLVFYQAGYYQRWLAGIGPDFFGFREHFVNTPFEAADIPAATTVTLVEAGVGGETTVALVAGADMGELLITTDNAENDGANIQWKGEAFKLASGKPAYFGIRFKTGEATESDILVGLCITNTDLLGGMTDGAYFRKVDGSAAVSAVLEKDSSETTGAAFTLAADTYYTLEILFDGTNVDFYVDGVALTRLAQTNLPDDEYLTPSIHFLTGNAAVETMNVDWIAAFQINA